VLFDGRDMSAFDNGDKWIIKDGHAEVSGGGIKTKQAFGDCQLHVEFATPEEVKGESQGRGNSGVYLMGKYEVQILDSFDNKTYFDGQCGSLYKQQPPTVNVSRGPGEWQSFDIIFEAPRFSSTGSVERPAYVTVLHNGVLIHNHLELKGGTFFDQPPHYEAHAEKLPIHIQDHGNPLRFRNIWVRENIQPIQGELPPAQITDAHSVPTPAAIPPDVGSMSSITHVEAMQCQPAASPCWHTADERGCCPRLLRFRIRN
jgi:hypothetical protein